MVPRADGANVGGWPRATFAVALGGCLIIAAYLVWRTAVLQPYSDMFDWIARYYRFRADGDLAGYLLAPHNFHRIVWTFLALDLDIRLFGAVGVLPIAVALACLAVTAAILASVAADAAGTGFRLVGGGLAAALSTMGCHILDVSLHITTPYLHGLVFGVAAIALGEPAATSAAGLGRRAAALVCAAAAGLGIAGGLAVWLVLAFGAWRRRDWPWLMTVAAAGAVFCALYASGQPTPPNPGHGGHGLSALGDAVALGLNYLGLPWTRGAPALGWLLGLVVLALGLAAIALRGRAGATRPERVATQLILLSLGVAALTVIGRTGLEAPRDVPMRYAVFMIPLHAGLCILALPAARRLWIARPKLGAAAVYALSALMVSNQVLMAVFAIRTADINRQVVAAFRAGATTPQMEVIYADLSAARAIEDRLRCDGFFQFEVKPPGQRTG